MKRAFLFTIFFVISSFIACFLWTIVSNDSNTNSKDTVTANDSITYIDNNIEDMIMMQTILLNNK